MRIVSVPIVVKETGIIQKYPIIYVIDFYFSIYTFVTFYLLERLKLMKKEYRYRNIKDEFEKYNYVLNEVQIVTFLCFNVCHYKYLNNYTYHASL